MGIKYLLNFQRKSFGHFFHWLCVSLGLFACIQLKSQAQNLDPSFKASVLGKFKMNGQITSSALQTDKKLLIIGDFTSIDGLSRKSLARLNADGGLDLGFTPDKSANGVIRAIALQPNGKILIAGNFTTYRGVVRNKIARLHSNGTLDTAFHAGTAANSFSLGTGDNNYISAIAVQPDGKIVVGGYFTTTSGLQLSKIARLNTDGTVDQDFNPGLGVNNTVNSVAIQPDGKIIIGGSFTAVNNTSRIRIARLNPDGSLDTTFNVGTNIAADASVEIYKVLVQPDGKILIAGDFISVNGTARNYYARLNANGTLDAAFNTAAGANKKVVDMVLQTNGKIVLVGEFTTINGIVRKHVVRLNPDGTLDNKFDTSTNEKVAALALLPNGNLIIVGNFTSVRSWACQKIAQLFPDGQLNTRYNLYRGTSSEVKDLVLQPDGKILLAGNFTHINGISRNHIARLNSNGTVDSTFNPGAGPSSFVNCLVLQPDGKVLIGGNFTTVNKEKRAYIARLLPNGRLDAAFTPEADDVVYALALQKNGNIVVGGRFTKINGKTKERIARLLPNGTIDPDFTTPKLNRSVSALLVDATNNIVLGGSFTEINKVTRKYIARLLPTGRLDASFNAGTGPNNDVRSIVEQADGKIIFGGAFTQVNGLNKKGIARFTADGTLDSTFNSVGSGPNREVYKVLLRPDGRIMMGGIFTNVDGTTRNRIARLFPDGSLDVSFRPFTSSGSGANRDVNTLALLPDGRLLVGGFFTTINGKSNNRIALLSAKASQTIEFTPVAKITETDSPVLLTAKASSKLPVTLTVISGPAFITDHLLTVTGAGVVKVRASQAGNDDYEAAPDVEQTFCVDPAKPTIMVNGNILAASSDKGNQWYRNGTAIANATGKTFIVTETGNYTLTTTVGTCVSVASESKEVTKIISGSSSVPVSATLSIFPNPATTVIYLKAGNMPAGPVTVSLIDPTGRLLYRQVTGNTAAQLDLKIPVTTLPRGYAILHVVTPNGTIRRHFILN